MKKDIFNGWHLVAASVLGAIICYLSIGRLSGPRGEGGFVKKEAERAVETVEGIIARDVASDSIAERELERQDDIIDKNRKNAKHIIDSGVDPFVYDSLVRSNRWRGAKRKSD